MCASLCAAFETYRDDIDAYNDTRDRLIKTSRDVTSLSKKAIFHMHRFSFDEAWPAYEAGRLQHTPKNETLLREAHAKLDEIYDALRACAASEGLASVSLQPSAAMLRFERCIGASLEELVEAASFLHFLEHNALVPYADVQAKLCHEGRMLLSITPMRYMLGLCDLTGELMRFAINAVASRDPMRIMDQVLQMQRAIYYGMSLSLTPST